MKDKVLDAMMDEIESSINNTIDDLELFYSFIQNVYDRNDINIFWDIDPDTKLIDKGFYDFQVSIPSANIAVTFGVSVLNAETIPLLSTDPYIKNLSSMVDVDVDDDVIKIEKVLEILNLADNIYFEMIRPFNIMLSPDMFNSDATIEFATRTLLTTITSFMSLDANKKENKHKRKIPSYIKLASVDGKLVD